MIRSDFATVQWAREMTVLLQNFASLSPADLRKLGGFLERWAEFRQNGGELAEPQLQVIMQALHTKDLVKLETDKGGVLVEFTGGGFAYECFLIRADGKVPNSRYAAQKSE